MQKDIQEEYEFSLFENKYYKKKLERVKTEFYQYTSEFSIVLNDLIDNLIEEDRILLRKIVGSEDELLTKKENKPKKQNSAVKKTFREIAKKSHPDRLLEESEQEIEKRTELFAEAKKSMECEDVTKLLEIAKELDIEPPKPDQDQIDLILENTNGIMSEIKQMRSSVAWEWAKAKPNKKEDIVLGYIKYLAVNFKDKV